MLLLPATLRAQHYIQFVDTVMVSGYFYLSTDLKKNRVKEWEGVYSNHYYFVPDSIIAGRPFAHYLKDNFEHFDKEKYLSAPIDNTFTPYDHADSATLSVLNKVITVNPFVLGSRPHAFGLPKWYAWATWVKMRWIKLKMHHCEAIFGFDYPPTMDLAFIRGQNWTYVYLPLKVLEIDRKYPWWNKSHP
ncbi:hypothetical protein [Chitinophaga rhizosphaerae]|uniref:hypothetical protein n=1 Tax=Chitinophaga rhizosphaerae TaxID=1864947 RepID=UPI000F801E6A|nr:hypothetical protein [Chitinophaga rhizosphaerae]